MLKLTTNSFHWQTESTDERNQTVCDIINGLTVEQKAAVEFLIASERSEAYDEGYQESDGQGIDI